MNLTRNRPNPETKENRIMAKTTKTTRKTTRTISRLYKGEEIKVQVTKDGFRYDGEDYTSATAVAKAITGYKNVNGRVWLGI